EQAAALAGLMGCTDRSAPCVQGQRERLLEAMTGHLAALAARQPVVLLFEDAHWIDPTSLELLSRTAARIRSLPVLLVISFRPEFRPPWAGLPHVTVLRLGGLRRREARMLAERTAGTAVLPAGTARQIIDRAEGIPLFIEELTRAAVEADWHDVMSGSAPPGATLPEPAIPTALYASLAARLDRLPDARDVAQIAAVIGREFSFDLLTAVAGGPEAALEGALVRLVEAGLVSPHGTTPRADYAFRHSLIRDVAYSMQLRDRRRQLHAQVAETMRQHFPDQAAPELLARHYMLAGLIGPAVRYLLLAAQRAFTASAYHEATNHLRKGFELIEHLPEGPLRTRFQLDLKATLSLVRDASRGYGHMFQPVFTTWRWRPVWDGNSLDG
ncbi:MAG TPA: AAA family ATPase, partial [Rhodopila sp.]|nr:AAA family ATPase [Rhodopila sp.]